ncbi:uncharacterized protein G2W53_031493 [Senna tora]|uniref:Uncharacterized protein n=1 Tax=Senna tora TaxID=362788 RepID=A0A834T8Q5_9FABA|nr:uncharacterized protein G2W53_031493 [Senna tora]
MEVKAWSLKMKEYDKERERVEWAIGTTGDVDNFYGLTHLK